MGKSQIFRQAREEVRAGQDRRKVFETYQGQIKRPVQLAMVIASIPDPARKEAHLIANSALVVLLVVAALTKLLSVFVLFPQFGPVPLIGLAIIGIILPVICAIEVARFNGQMYWVLPIFCVGSLFQIVAHELDSPLGLLIDGGLVFAIGALSVYIKMKVFPNIGMGGVKKDASGAFILQP